MTNDEKQSLALSAYYDGELSRFGRWRVERMLRNSADLRRELAELDIAKILGPVPINRLRQEYLTSLVNGFVGIPGIDNRSQLGQRIGLTRQAIHRNINS